jgi:hypothetical protein
MPISNRNTLRRLFAKPADSRSQLGYLQTILNRALRINSHTGVLLKMPVLFLAYTLPLTNGAGETVSYTNPIFAPVLAATIVYILISFRPLLFLGEAERYLNHVAFFIASSAVYFALTTGISWVLYLLIGYGGLFWLLEYYLAWKQRLHDSMEAQAQEAIITYVKSRGERSVVVCFPYDAAGGVYRIMLETDAWIVGSLGLTEPGGDAFMGQYVTQYPYLRLEALDQMAEEFGVNLVIARNHDLNARGLGEFSPSKDWKRLQIGEPAYRVFERLPAIGYGEVEPRVK